LSLFRPVFPLIAERFDFGVGDALADKVGVQAESFGALFGAVGFAGAPARFFRVEHPKVGTSTFLVLALLC